MVQNSWKLHFCPFWHSNFRFISHKLEFEHCAPAKYQWISIQTLPYHQSQFLSIFGKTLHFLLFFRPVAFWGLSHIWQDGIWWNFLIWHKIRNDYAKNLYKYVNLTSWNKNVIIPRLKTFSCYGNHTFNKQNGSN